MKRIHLLLAVLILLIALVAAMPYLRNTSLVMKLSGKSTVEDRLREYGDAARGRLAPYFAREEIKYPPKRLVLVGLKDERVLQVYAMGDKEKLRCIRSYPMLAASGGPGPKLRYGDGQVPEGIYRISFLNPNSRYHLSMRLNYPNEFDCRMGKCDGREDLGSDIMIHGSNVSVGCLAMGDQAAEDLFVLTADTGIDNIKVILSPVDFRVRELPKNLPDMPVWTDALYQTIRAELKQVPLPDKLTAPQHSQTP